MEFATIVCQKCHQDTPEIGSYCMHCGKTPRPLPSTLWKADKLEVSDDADFGPLMTAIFAEEQEENPTPEVIRWAINRLTDKQSQVLIRLYGLDGGGMRNIVAVSREAGVTDTAIYNNRHKALRQLLHPRVSKVLRGLRPAPSA